MEKPDSEPESDSDDLDPKHEWKVIPPRKVTQEEIKQRLAEHKRWLESGEKSGAQFESDENEDLSGLKFHQAILTRARLSYSHFAGAKFWHAKINLAELDESDLTGANLQSADLTDSQLEGAVLKGAHLSMAILCKANLMTANLTGADLHLAHLQEAKLNDADLRGASVHRAYFDHANVHGANLAGVRGLFGRDRASGLESVHGAEHARYGHPHDYADWSRLRFIRTLRIFAASYYAFIGISIYALSVRWYNDNVRNWHQWAAEHVGQTTTHWPGLVQRIPTLPVARQFGFTLLAILLLAVASTVFVIRCPEPIKEATETRWTRELRNALIEYRSAMYSGFVSRYVCAACFLIGGLYTLGYIILKGYEALRFLFQL